MQIYQITGKDNIMSEEVRRMFADISGKYDFPNDFLSLGIHRLWRKKAVMLSGAKETDRVLDCACGTGDLAIAYKKKVGNKGKVIATDFTKEMIELGKLKSQKKGYEITFEFADVMNLRYEDEIFDRSGISFGIRNVDYPVQGISEMARVVRKGGTVTILEFGEPNTLISLPYRIYGKTLMPFLGKLFSKHASAYEYLPTTAINFPCRDKFIDIMNETNLLSDCKYYSLCGGIAYIYVGIKI